MGKYIPGLDIHLSTQETVYNIEGIRKGKRNIVYLMPMKTTEKRGVTENFRVYQNSHGMSLNNPVITLLKNWLTMVRKGFKV